MAGVQRHLFRWVSRSGDTFENLLPNAPLAPSCEPVVDGLVRAVFLRAILPAAADFQNMHDPAQYASIILALGTRLVRRQMRNDLRPLLIVEPKQIRIHRLGPMSVDQAIESNEPCLGLDPRIALQPDEDSRATVSVDPRLLAHFDEEGRRWSISAGSYEISAGFDAEHRDQTAIVQLDQSSLPP
jgi:Fibronectin type III-like domain